MFTRSRQLGICLERSWMKRFLPPIIPLAITAILFLVMYNNLDNGKLILVVLLLLNLGIFVIPSKYLQDLWIVSGAKPACACAACALVTILALEAVFPLVWPQEYSQLLDLTKKFSRNALDATPGTSLIFVNEDQRRVRKKNSGKPAEDLSVGWHSPGKVFVYYGYEPNLKTSYENRFHWNSSGYFDHDYDLNKPAGNRRIVIIGDSYVEAVQVPLKRTFHKLLEELANRGVPENGKQRIEVIALGNSGTGQVEHFKVLQSQAFAYNPDVIIVTLCSNDFCDDDPELKKELVLASGEISPSVRGLAGHGFFASAFALRRIDDLRRNRIGISPELLQWAGSEIPRIETAWARTLHQIQASRDQCRERGILFLLVYLGSDLEVKYFLDPDGTIARLQDMGGPHKNLSWDLTRSIRRVTSYCETHDIPMISLLGPFIAAQRGTGNQVFGDHYTMFGHEVAAQALDCAVNLLNNTNRERSFRPCTSGESRPRASPVTTVAPEHDLSRSSIVSESGR